MAHLIDLSQVRTEYYYVVREYRIALSIPPSIDGTDESLIPNPDSPWMVFNPS